MEGQTAVRALVADLVAVAVDEQLQGVDGAVGGNIVRHQQLVTALSSGQQLTEHHQNTLILNGNDTHLVALALYSEGVFSQCPFRCRCVYAEALVDTKSCIAPKVEGKLESFCRRYSSAG